MSTIDGKKATARPRVNWVAVEAAFRAGIRSLRSIGHEYGVAAPSILKHMRKFGITRDLEARVRAEAEHKVYLAVAANTAAANAAANGTTARNERAIVASNADVLAQVQMSHRTQIANFRQLAVSLLAELEATCKMPNAFGKVQELLPSKMEDEAAIKALRDTARLVPNLPVRAKVFKDLADTLQRVVAMEREAFGLDSTRGTDGRPMVVIRDYTGRGDPDSPWRDGGSEEAA